MAVDAPDTGWSWVVAFSCSYIHFALFGLFRSSGVMYVALLATYGATREEAAWPFSLCSAIFQLTAPLASVAANYVSVRKASLFGSVIATIGITCCCFADSVQWINIFYGIVHGVGFGFAVTLVPVIVNQYFIRHRATAIGIAFSGGTVSSFIFPVAMEYLLDTYGLRGSFLVLGGVVMNTLVAASMLRTPPWLEKPKTKILSIASSQDVDSFKVSGRDPTAEESVLKRMIIESEVKDRNTSHVPIHSLEYCKKSYPHLTIDEANDQSRSENVHSNNVKNFREFQESLIKDEQLKLIPFDKEGDIINNQMSDTKDNTVNIIAQIGPLERDSSENQLNKINNRLSDTSNIVQESKCQMSQPEGECNGQMGRSEKIRLSNGKMYSSNTLNPISPEDEYQQSNPDDGCYSPNHQRESSASGLESVIMEVRHPSGKHLCDSPEFVPLLTQGTLPVKCEQRPSTLNESAMPLVSNKKVTVVPKSEANKQASSSPTKNAFTRCGDFQVCKSVVEILRNPMFHLLTFSMCGFFLLLHTFFMVIVDFAKDKGIPESDAIYVLSMFSLTDLVGRAGLGWVTDRNFIRRKNMVMMNLAIIGILNHLYPIANTLTGILVISAFHGLAVGSSITLFFVLQAEYMGMRKLPLTIGMTSFFNGVLTFLRPGMTGLFRDQIGSYNYMFHFLGTLKLLIALVWLTEPWLSKRSKEVDESILSSRLTDARKNSC